MGSLFLVGSRCFVSFVYFVCFVVLVLDAANSGRSLLALGLHVNNDRRIARCVFLVTNTCVDEPRRIALQRSIPEMNMSEYMYCRTHLLNSLA